MEREGWNTELGFKLKGDPGSILVCPEQDSQRSITGTAGLILKGLGFPAGIISSCFPQQDTGQATSGGCYPSMPWLQRWETPGAVRLLSVLKILHILSSLAAKRGKKPHTAVLEHKLNVKERWDKNRNYCDIPRAGKRRGYFFCSRDIACKTELWCHQIQRGLVVLAKNTYLEYKYTLECSCEASGELCHSLVFTERDLNV